MLEEYEKYSPMVATPPIENPFDDVYTIENPALSHKDDHDYHVGKTITVPEYLTIPILGAAPTVPQHEYESSVSSLSTTSTTPPLPFNPVEWTNADINYLLGIIYPNEVMAQNLIFSPPLENLHADGAVTDLKLYLRVPTQPIPADAYSKQAPIGTGRPNSKVLLVEAYGDKPASARQSLAKHLLADKQMVDWVSTQYRLTSELYRLPSASLEDVKRGMVAMSQVPEPEWYERFIQLSDAVDGSWSLDARLELFLLGAGHGELNGWVISADVALNLSEDERRAWSAVYSEAGHFLRIAVQRLEPSAYAV